MFIYSVSVDGIYFIIHTYIYIYIFDDYIYLLLAFPISRSCNLYTAGGDDGPPPCTTVPAEAYGGSALCAFRPHLWLCYPGRRQLSRHRVYAVCVRLVRMPVSNVFLINWQCLGVFVPCMEYNCTSNIHCICV